MLPSFNGSVNRLAGLLFLLIEAILPVSIAASNSIARKSRDVRLLDAIEAKEVRGQGDGDESRPGVAEDRGAD